jgi:hypothetical protein
MLPTKKGKAVEEDSNDWSEGQKVNLFLSIKNITFLKKGTRMKHRAILFAPNFVLLVLLAICTASGVSAHIRGPATEHFWRSGSNVRPRASVGAINLALNKPITASSLENADYRARNAVDGNLNTRWSSGAGHGTEWLQIDLGSTYIINGVNLYWERAYATRYQIQVSVDQKRGHRSITLRQVLVETSS